MRTTPQSRSSTALRVAAAAYAIADTYFVEQQRNSASTTDDNTDRWKDSSALVHLESRALSHMEREPFPTWRESPIPHGERALVLLEREPYLTWRESPIPHGERELERAMPR
jgi:hypothetical protein